MGTLVDRYDEHDGELPHPSGRVQADRQDRSEESVSTLHNLSSVLVVMITRLKYGITSRGNVFSP